MGDFTFTPPLNQEGPVPPPADQFDVPPPNFRQIGQMFTQGVQDAGGLFSFLKDITNTVVKIIATVIGTVLSMLLCIVAFLINFINRVDDTAAPGMNAVAAQSLAHVFGIPVSGAGPRKLGAGVDTAGAADNIGRTVMQAIISGVGQSGGATIQPTSAPTEQFLSKITHIGIEGWMEGALTEAVTLGQFEAVMQLAPIMSDILGLGRLSRRVLAPPLKILVEDPYTWKLNLQYRPTLLAHDQAVRQYLRGRMTRDQLDAELGKQGFSSAAQDALININSKLLSAGDVDYLVARGHWSTDQGVQSLQNDGYDQTTANILLNLAGQRRLDVHDAELLALYVAAFERGEIDQATLHDQITASTMPDGEKAVAEAVAVARRQLNVKHLTLAEVETLVKAHIMSVDDLRTWMTRENYPLEEQTLLELWLFGKITSADQAAAAKKAKADAAAAAKQAKQTASADKAAAATSKLATKGVSVATFEQLVEQGQRTFQDFTAFLTAQGLPASSIADLVDNLHAKITAKQTLEQQHAALTAEADTKHVPLATTEKAVLAGTLTMGELDAFLKQNEYAAGDITIIENYVQEQLDAAKAKAGAKATATAAAAEKDISLPELERAARLGLITVQAYSDALDAAGFAPSDRDVLVGILNDQIAKDTATLATRKAAAAAATKKHISLAALEKSVLAGIRPIADYQAQLSLLGFDATDQASLVDLLQLQLDHAKDVATKHAAAAAKMAARNVSLADLEAAVKLGVTSIDQYKAQLAIDGWSAADIELLATSLLDEIAAARAKKKVAALPGQATPAPAPSTGP